MTPTGTSGSSTSPSRGSGHPNEGTAVFHRLDAPSPLPRPLGVVCGLLALGVGFGMLGLCVRQATARVQLEWSFTAVLAAVASFAVAVGFRLVANRPRKGGALLSQPALVLFGIVYLCLMTKMQLDATRPAPPMEGWYVSIAALALAWKRSRWSVRKTAAPAEMNREPTSGA